MDTTELRDLLDRMAAGTTTHADAVKLAKWIHQTLREGVELSSEAVYWLNAHDGPDDDGE